MLPISSKSQQRGVLGSLLVVLSLGLILNLGALIFSIHVLTRGSRRYTYLEGDRPRELPIDVRSIQNLFHDDPDHYKLEGDAAWAEWDALRPPGSGYVFLGEEYYPFDVSMWHQMHCLNHLRAVLLNGDDGSDHTEHCFHYLRESILCAADTTLEPGGTSKMLANGDRIATGIRTIHTCRNWKQVYDWMAKEYEKWTPDMHRRFNEPSH